MRATPTSYRATFATDRVIFTRRDGAVETHTEIVVVAGEQAEIRRVTLINRSHVTRELELTSYGEVVLCPPDADRAHPGVSEAVRRDGVGTGGDTAREPTASLSRRDVAVVRARRRIGPRAHRRRHL